MGRSIYTDQVKTHPPGFFLEVNSSLMEGLWAALALEKHPEVADEPHDLERTFALCKHVTWADFWRAFPYKLREGGSFLDELDAIGLLVSSPISKQRFQRYFEQCVCSNSIGGGRPSRPSMQAPDQQQQQQMQARAGFRAGSRLGQPALREAQRVPLPLRYRGQYQHLFNTQQQRREQQEEEMIWQAHLARPLAAGGANNNPVPHVPHPTARRSPATAAARLRPLSAGTGRVAAAAAPPSAARLVGRRRPWAEVCEEGTPLSAAAAAQAAGVEQVQPAAAVGAGTADTAGPSQQQQQQEEQTSDNSQMWRAVHDWLTADDETLLLIVSRLVPYDFKELLRDAGLARQQLQQLSRSRQVPQKVVSAISDRLSVTSENNFVHLTASSGYSKKAAAAAAALDCSSRVPYYISLAGLDKEEDVELAIMQGLFVEGVSRPPTPDRPVEVHGGIAAAAAAAVGDAAGALPERASSTAAAAIPARATAAAAGGAGTDDMNLSPMARILAAELDTPEEIAAADAAAEAYLEGAPANLNIADIQRVGAAAAQRAAAVAAAERARLAGDTDAAAARQREAAAATAALAAIGTRTEATEADVAQMEQELGVEFEGGFSLQQRARILESLRVRREVRAALAAATAQEPRAAAAAAPVPIRSPDHRFAQVQLAAVRAPAAQQQQEQQHEEQLEEPSEPEDEGFDRMFGFLAGTGFGFGPGRPRPTARRTARRRRNTPPGVQAIERSPGFYEYSDATDEDEEEEQGTEEGSDDGDQGLGIWRVERREQRLGVLNPGDDLLERIGLLQPQRAGGRREGSEHRSFRCGEQFAAHLTLLGTCYKQPLLLVLDEADSALVAGDGQGFRQLLTKLLCMLPQAVVVVVSSFKSKAFTDNAAFLRQQGREAEYDLADGKLSIVCRRVPKTLFYRCLM